AQPVVLDVVDLSWRPEHERKQAARQLVDELTQSPLDPASGRPFGILLLRLGESDHVLGMVFHHLVFDGWSKLVLFRELRALYDAYSRDQASALGEPPIQYGDFAEWQRSWLRDELLEHELAYWREALDGVPAALELPTDHLRPAASTMRG